MFIEYVCPGLVEAVREVFSSLSYVTADEFTAAFVKYGDYCFGLGVLSVLLVALLWLFGRDVVRFVRRELAIRRKNAS